MSALRRAAEGQACVRCGTKDGTVVGAHYTGYRRLAYGGGLGIKVNDLCIAHLCATCHNFMDSLSRYKAEREIHSEQFQHYILLTLIRLFEQGVLRV